jgi:hypothetical protein
LKKYLLVFANYSDRRQYLFENFLSLRNRRFCDIHGYNYIEITNELIPFRGNYTWLKFTKIQELIKDGTFQYGDKILNLDADMSIQKFDLDYPNSKSFSYSIDSGNTHCMGNFSLIINDWTVKMIDLILCDERYEKLRFNISYHEHFKVNSSFWEDFREQASWYSLAGIKRHSQVSFWDLANFGWHSDYNENVVYSLEELYENVEIVDTCWNVTLMENENDDNNIPWFLNKLSRSEVIIRHFAGGVIWSDDYLYLDS